MAMEQLQAEKYANLGLVGGFFRAGKIKKPGVFAWFFLARAFAKRVLGQRKRLILSGVVSGIDHAQFF